VTIEQAVPFFLVADLAASMRFYVDGLGFRMTKRWIDEGRIRWCWLERDRVAVMLQEMRAPASGPRGAGATVCFFCDDALAIYRELLARRIAAREPYVGNRLWVTELTDPDGYKLLFESPTDAPEETRYSDWLARRSKP